MAVYTVSVWAQDVINRVCIGSVWVQDVINCGLYKQCRGEWKLARVASTGDVYGWHPLAGICYVFVWFVLRATFQSPLQLRGGAFE